MQLSPFRHTISNAPIPLASFQKRAQHIGARSIGGGPIGPGDNEKFS
jgi:hypothetical protein